MKTTTRQTLETFVASLLNENPDTTYDVCAYELWRNSDGGFDCNDVWRIASGVDRQGVLDAARGRWEVFKVNYAPKARVCDISDISYDAALLELEVDCIPFLKIVEVEE